MLRDSPFLAFWNLQQRNPLTAFLRTRGTLLAFRVPRKVISGGPSIVCSLQLIIKSLAEKCTTQEGRWSKVFLTKQLSAAELSGNLKTKNRFPGPIEALLNQGPDSWSFIMSPGAFFVATLVLDDQRFAKGQTSYPSPSLSSTSVRFQDSFGPGSHS